MEYSCKDNIIGRSVWRPKWGNGFRDQSSEECDDNNNTDGDGCSSNWKIENTFYWIGGSSTSQDTCGVLVYIYFNSIDSENTILIGFSQAMNNSIISNDDILIKITGPASSYSFTYSSKFTQEKQLQIKFLAKDIIFGNQNEVIDITLLKTKFASLNGYPLYNNTVSCNPNQIIDNKAAIASAGTSLYSTLTFTLGVMMTSNILL